MGELSPSREEEGTNAPSMEEKLAILAQRSRESQQKIEIFIVYAIYIIPREETLAEVSSFFSF